MPLNAMKVQWSRLAVTIPSRDAVALWPSRLSEFVHRILASPLLYTDVLPLIGVTGLAAALRLGGLMDIPPGFHGDEGLAGIDAHRIAEEGWIGPYLPSALGTVSGTFYWTAAVFRIFGESAYAVRLSFAILGIATVPLAYLAFRIMYDRRVALIASVILAVMAWHIHLSRISFVPVSWPLMEVATLLFLFAGFRTGRWYFFALAGLAFGGGLYGYLIYPIFMVALSIYLLWVLASSYRNRFPEFARHMAVFAVFTILIALPLIDFAKDPDSPFWSRFGTYSVTKTAQYEAADGPFEKVEFFAGRAKQYFKGFVASPSFDAVDATGIKPVLDRISPFLIVGGIVLAFRRWRKHQYVLPLLMLLLIPMGALWSVDGMYRRTLGMAPFMALLAALPLALAWEHADRLRSWWKRSAGYLGIAAVLAVMAAMNFNLYFDTIANDPKSKWVFAREIAEASRFLNEVPQDPYVYFYSSRWSFNYETRQYLAQGLEGEDRSREFSPSRTFSLAGIDRSRDAVLMFLPPYADQLPYAAALYPGGQAFQGEDSDGTVLFSAYVLPAASASAPSPPSAP